MNGQRFTWLGFGGLAAIVGGCQLVSGLSGYQESGGTSGSVSATSGSGSGSGGAGGSGGDHGASVASTGGDSSSGSGDCLPGTVTCGGSTCIDRMINPLNCGECGRSCADSLTATPSCEQGNCAPVLVDASNLTVTAISANEQAVCWAGVKSKMFQGIQVRLAPSWGEVGPSGLSFAGSIGGLAVLPDGKSVLYSHNTLTSWAVDQWTFSAAASILATTSMSTLIAGGAVVVPGDGNFYWAGETANSEWHLYGTPLVGAPAQPSVDRVTNTASLPIATAPDKNVFWPEAPHFNRLNAPSVVGGALYKNFLQNEPRYLAADTDPTGYLYWIGLVGPSEPSTLSRILKTATDQGIADVEAYQVPTAVGLVADDAHVYWLERGPCPSATGRLMKLTWGGDPEPLVSGLVCPTNLALGGNYLYYSVGLIGSMEIYRVVR